MTYTEEIIPLNQNHQCYQGDEKEAREAFFRRYGYKATRAIHFNNVWWLGPLPKDETSDEQGN